MPKHHSFLVVFYDRRPPDRVSSRNLSELRDFLRSWLPMTEEAAVELSRELRRGHVVVLEGLATLVPDAEVPVFYFGAQLVTPPVLA